MEMGALKSEISELKCKLEAAENSNLFLKKINDRAVNLCEKLFKEYTENKEFFATSLESIIKQLEEVIVDMKESCEKCSGEESANCASL